MMVEKDVAQVDTTPQSGLICSSELAILVVEDCQDNAEMLVELLQQLGHRVRTAPTASSAFELLKQSLPDVVLLDLDLPDMDGCEIAKMIRAEHGTRIRILAVTGFSGDAPRERAREAGFDAFVVKPYRIEELVALMSEKAA
jgi:CheY-like chemotaxis protein